MHHIHLIPGYGSYYYEDVTALQHSTQAETERWFMPARNTHMTRARELAEVVSIGLANGDYCGWGDMVGVSYGGKAGRKKMFRHQDANQFFKPEVLTWLRQYSGSSLRAFNDDWQHFLKVSKMEHHPAIDYGLSQAMLALLAPRGELFRVIAKEWQLNDMNLTPLPLQGSSGNNRKDNADKMIYRQFAALPHSQVDQIDTQIGPDGEHLLTYVQWLMDRLQQFAQHGLTNKNYAPIIHLDVHGALGIIKKHSLPALADYLCCLEDKVTPYELRIESPILAETLEQQIAIYSELKELLAQRHARVKIVADEWANNKQDIERFVDQYCVDMIHIKAPDVGSIVHIVDALLYCQKHHMATLLGGSCVETDISTRTTTHIAMVTRPDILLVKPGMGIDEGYMLIHNEMARIAALSLHRL